MKYKILEKWLIHQMWINHFSMCIENENIISVDIFMKVEQYKDLKNVT